MLLTPWPAHPSAAVTVPSYTGLDQQLPLTDAAGQLDVAADPAAAAAAAQAAALAAAPFMALGPGELPVGLRVSCTTNSREP